MARMGYFYKGAAEGFDKGLKQGQKRKKKRQQDERYESYLERADRDQEMQEERHAAWQEDQQRLKQKMSDQDYQSYVDTVTKVADRGFVPAYLAYQNTDFQDDKVAYEAFNKAVTVRDQDPSTTLRLDWFDDRMKQEGAFGFGVRVGEPGGKKLPEYYFTREEMDKMFKARGYVPNVGKDGYVRYVQEGQAKGIPSREESEKQALQSAYDERAKVESDKGWEDYQSVASAYDVGDLDNAAIGELTSGSMSKEQWLERYSPPTVKESGYTKGVDAWNEQMELADEKDFGFVIKANQETGKVEPVPIGKGSQGYFDLTERDDVKYKTAGYKREPVKKIMIQARKAFKSILKNANRYNENSAPKKSPPAPGKKAEIDMSKFKQFDILDGYLFVGGDPEMSKNWVKLGEGQ